MCITFACPVLAAGEVLPVQVTARSPDSLKRAYDAFRDARDREMAEDQLSTDDGPTADELTELDSAWLFLLPDNGTVTIVGSCLFDVSGDNCPTMLWLWIVPQHRQFENSIREQFLREFGNYGFLI